MKATPSTNPLTATWQSPAASTTPPPGSRLSEDASSRSSWTCSTGNAGYAAPFALPGKGGWGMPYAVSKAGFHRIAVQVAFEYGDRGIVALNAQPGMVATERIMAVGRSRELIAKYGAAPEVVGRTLAHVVAAANDGPESLPWPNGDTVELQDLAHTLGWLDGPGRFPDPT